jgi:predicted transcriptional regulator
MCIAAPRAAVVAARRMVMRAGAGVHYPKWVDLRLSLGAIAYAAYDLRWRGPCAGLQANVSPGRLSMKPVSELLKRRDSAGWRIEPGATMFDALEALARHEVGALMVMSHDKLVGVISERDYTRKVALQGRNSKEVLVAELMTPDVLTVTPATRTRECMTLMSQKRIRHLPVVEGDKVVGMISIRDLMDDIIADHEETIEQLRTYIQS